MTWWVSHQKYFSMNSALSSCLSSCLDFIHGWTLTSICKSNQPAPPQTAFEKSISLQHQKKNNSPQLWLSDCVSNTKCKFPPGIQDLNLIRKRLVTPKIFILQSQMPVSIAVCITQNSSAVGDSSLLEACIKSSGTMIASWQGNFKVTTNLISTCPLAKVSYHKLCWKKQNQWQKFILYFGRSLRYPKGSILWFL